MGQCVYLPTTIITVCIANASYQPDRHNNLAVEMDGLTETPLCLHNFSRPLQIKLTSLQRWRLVALMFLIKETHPLMVVRLPSCPLNGACSFHRGPLAHVSSLLPPMAAIKGRHPPLLPSSILLSSALPSCPTPPPPPSPYGAEALFHHIAASDAAFQCRL